MYDIEWIKQQLNLPHINAAAMPNIALYMDQVTTFMESELESCKRYPDDKIITKTMVNNYTKNHLLPPSEKKKYSKEHIFLLIFIYYMKNILSITDIQALLTPLIDSYFFKEKDSELNLEEIYTKITEQLSAEESKISESILESYDNSAQIFEGKELTEKEKEYMQNFTFICQLAYDICVRKQLMERLIDQMPKDDSKKKK